MEKHDFSYFFGIIVYQPILNNLGLKEDTATAILLLRN